MKKEDKDLLVRDLCGRLPYSPLCEVEGHDYHGFKIDKHFVFLNGLGLETFKSDKVLMGFQYTNIKPFLRPMSDISEEEKSKINLVTCHARKEDNFDAMIEWLNKNFIDYRHLIDRGLATSKTKDELEELIKMVKY